MNNGEGFAFFYWHRHQWPTMLGDTACSSSGDARSFCRKFWAYRYRVCM